VLLAAVLSAWLQYAADGKPHARAVVGAAPCPALTVDGRTAKMAERAAASAAFADVVCDAVVASDAKTIRIGERALPRPAHAPATIVVLGDTGCRVSTLAVQACDDPASWPFPQIALSIAAVHPDLVVHVGDFLYREKPCPLLARCADSPYGDDAAAWNADWFAPAAPLLASAPVILMRGNHETCDRNGAGWFRYLDPHPNGACADATEPYAVDLGGLRIVAFDSAAAEDRKTDPARQPIYRKQFAQARALAAGTSWFVTHRPPYTNDDERTAMGDALAPFAAVLSGHLHEFAAMNVKTLPPLLINGEGGAKLDPNFAALLGLEIGDLHVDGPVFGSSHFGFTVYTRDGASWNVSLRGTDGAERARCRLADRAVHCTSV
jgi:predicted phosphodiesterase